MDGVGEQMIEDEIRRKPDYYLRHQALFGNVGNPKPAKRPKAVETSASSGFNQIRNWGAGLLCRLKFKS